MTLKLQMMNQSLNDKCIGEESSIQKIEVGVSGASFKSTKSTNVFMQSSNVWA